MASVFAPQWRDFGSNEERSRPRSVVRFHTYSHTDSLGPTHTRVPPTYGTIDAERKATFPFLCKGLGVVDCSMVAPRPPL